MSEIEISSGSEDDTPDIALNTDMFQKMINLCRSHKKFPQQYVEDMNKMYKNCNEQQKNSKPLCNLVLKGIEFISPKNKESFQYAANVYNELLQLSKKDSKTENCVASTSNGNSSMTSKLENGTSKNTINDVNKMFKELIEKCYLNPNYPNSNIDVIDKLYKSLPLEFLDSKYFVLLLKEANLAIWPDSSKSSYVHIEHIYKQLLQFETSMKVQDSRMSADNKEINEKKMKKLKQLTTALKNIRKQIKALDEEEMDIENDDEFDSDSAYLMKDKYEKRIIQIYKRMCQLTDEPDFLEEPALRFKATNNRLVNKTIEKYYNFNKTFPDYFEIYTLLKCLRDKKNIDWTENELKNISHDAFLKLGKQLKLRRLNEYFGGWANINTEKDPAEENEELRKKLDASSKKLHFDLSELEKKFNTKQDYAEETEGSNLNDTDCELSSDNESIDKSLINSPEFNNKKSNKEFKPTKPILVKRKKLTSDSEKDGPPKKSQKTIYMESFNLRPSRGNLETIHDEKHVEINVNSENIPCKITCMDNVDDILNKNDSIDTVENKNQVTKNKSININNISNEETSDSENVSIKITNHVDDIPNTKNKTKCTDSSENSLENNTLSTIHFTDIDEDGMLVIDEGIKVDDNTNRTVAKKPQENKIKEVVSGVNAMNSNNKIINSEDNDPIITEPEVMINKDNDPIFSEPEVIIHEDSSPIISEPEIIIHDDKELTKDIIEINEHDDSDVEITSCDIPIVPVQNRKSLESIIKSMNFEKKYKWNTDAKCSNSKPPQTLHQNPGNVKQNMNHNLVNRWVMNNIRPPPTKPKTNNRHYRQLSNYQNVQSTFQKSVQTARQVTQCVTNMVQQQRNVQNNQSVHVTTMTTTTTVRQIVKNNQPHRSTTYINNSGKKPELIELD